MIRNYSFSKLLFFFSLLAVTIISSAQVSTLAGGADNVAYVDAVGTAARMGRMSGNMVCDGKGYLYFADYQNVRIRKIRLSDGAVTTVTGSGYGYVNGLLSEAKFWLPRGLAIDAAGENLYVSDQDCIRKIDLVNGLVSIVAGNGNSIQGSYLDGVGTNARFKSPYGLALDGSGNLYVADQGNNRIRQVRLSDGNVTTFAGYRYPGNDDGQGTNASFQSPGFITYDGAGYLYLSDQNNHRIRRLRLSDAMVTTIAGSSAGFTNGTGTAAQFNYPGGLALDRSGNLYVGDYLNYSVRKINLSNMSVSTLTGNGTPGYINGTLQNARFRYVTSLVFDENGNLYVGDETNYAIRKIASGALPVYFGKMQATVKNENLYISWQTLTESNNDHFLVQLSLDGANFTTIRTVQSKATEGNSSEAIAYSSTIPLTTLSLSAGFLLTAIMFGRYRRYVFIIAVIVCGVLSFSCGKKDIFKDIENSKLFVRIVQVDKDGMEQVSKVVQVVRE